MPHRIRRLATVRKASQWRLACWSYFIRFRASVGLARINRTESMFFVAACLSLVSCWLRWGKLNGSQPEFRSFTRSVCCRRSTLGTVPRRWRCHRLRAALVTGCAEIALSFNRSFRARLFSRSNPFCHLSLSPLVTIPPKNWHLHTHDISSSDLVPMGS